jgi:hypothetical protein
MVRVISKRYELLTTPKRFNLARRAGDASL